ncbi:unnamed protein product, partial [Brachionus calyciflorus]
SISPLSQLNCLGQSSSILDQHLQTSNSISPTITSSNISNNLNQNYDLFSNEQHQIYNLFNTNETKSSVFDPFADLANEQLFNLASNTSEVQNNFAASLYANALNSEQTDNLNNSFSSLLNISNTTTQSSSNVNNCNLASILNGIL